MLSPSGCYVNPQKQYYLYFLCRAKPSAAEKLMRGYDSATIKKRDISYIWYIRAI